MGVYDGTTQYLYVDGVLKVSQAKTNVNTNTANITIGATNCAYFAGSIDDVRIYNRALSVSEVQVLYNTNPSQQQYTLTVAKSGTGSGTVTADSGTITWSGTTGTTSYSSGTSVTLTATPDPGTTFAGWSGACVGNSPTCTVKMDAAKSVTAVFGTNNQGTTVSGLYPFQRLKCRCNL